MIMFIVHFTLQQLLSLSCSKVLVFYDFSVEFFTKLAEIWLFQVNSNITPYTLVAQRSGG